MSKYESTTTYYNGSSVYYPEVRMMDHEMWNSAEYRVENMNQECLTSPNIASASFFYSSPSYCQGSSSEIEDVERSFHEGFFTHTPPVNISPKPLPQPVVRIIKKRNTANKKERRRTQSINNAFSCLRDKIPNVPADTKLSKIKTLKLAILYIKYLVGVLDGYQDPKSGFRAELKPLNRKSAQEKRAYIRNEVKSSMIAMTKGRTGWPQDVWAAELPEQD